MHDSSTDSESSLPWVKLSATDFPMLKMLLDIKSLIGNYHNEVIQLQLESESKCDHDPKGKSLLAIFSCLLCKDTANEDSLPVVPGRDQREHDARLTAPLKRIKSAGVTLNPDKCEFSCRKPVFLGHLIDQSGGQADPEKTSAIQAMKPPTNISEMRRFLGGVNQLRKFSPNL